MNTRYTLILVLIACFAGMSTTVNATQYETVATGEYAWDDSNAWVNGVMPPDNIGPGDIIDINCEVVLMTSLGNRGKIKVWGTLTIYGGSTAKSLINKGRVDIKQDGVIRILRNQNATSNPNVLTNVLGSVELDGTLEILGGALINMSNINVTFDGIIYNYGHQNGSNQVITSTGTVIDLDTYLGTLGSTGRLAEPDVTDTDWVCLPGNIDNTEGTITFQGGKYMESECDGGYTGPMLPTASCGAVTNIYAEGNLKSGLDLFWAPVDEAKKYVVGIQTSKAGFNNLAKVEENRISIPASMLTGTWNVKYTISAVCDEREADALTEESAIETLQRTGTTSSWNGESIDMFPNPVSEVLYIQPQMDVKNTTLEVYNPAGILVMSQEVADGGARIDADMSKMPSGTYLVVLNSGGEKVQKRIVVSD